MTENEKLRALLAEARERLMRTFGYGMDVDGNLASRIDAALAEPVSDDFRRGAEAMREAAANWLAAPYENIDAEIRNLPIPEDKP